MRATLLGLTLVVLPAAVTADEYVRGTVRRDGTYVAPHMRSEPNAYRFDNYSSRGNVNPYTGERGTQRNEFTSPPAYNYGRQHEGGAYQQPYVNPYSNPYSNPYGTRQRLY